MGWLDAVKNFAQNVAIGQNPDVYLKKVQMQNQFVNDEQRRRLAEEENARAATESGQRTEKFGHEKSGWGVEDALKAAGLTDAQARAKMAELKLAQAPEEFESEQAQRGAATEASRASASHARGEEARAGVLAPLQKQLAEQRLASEQMDNEVKKATQVAKIESVNDPAVNEKAQLNELIRLYQTQAQYGDEQQAKDTYAQIHALMIGIGNKRAATMQRRQSTNAMTGSK